MPHASVPRESFGNLLMPLSSDNSCATSATHTNTCTLTLTCRHSYNSDWTWLTSQVGCAFSSSSSSTWLPKLLPCCCCCCCWYLKCHSQRSIRWLMSMSRAACRQSLETETIWCPITWSVIRAEAQPGLSPAHTHTCAHTHTHRHSKLDTYACIFVHPVPLCLHGGICQVLCEGRSHNYVDWGHVV